MMLDAPCSFLDGAGHYLLAITARGTLIVWDTRRLRAVFKPTSVYPLLAPSSSSTLDSPLIIITAAKVRPNGCPVISLSNGTALAYDGDLCSWTEISSTWWSKGSDYWEGRIRTSSANVGRGIVKIMENEANDYLMAQRGERGGVGDGGGSGGGGGGGGGENDDVVMGSVEGQEQEKVGNGDDWKVALTLGHLESRMNAAAMLDSLGEYRVYLQVYAKKLAEEAFRGKAEELVRELLGPVYHRPGREEGGGGWQATLLGVHKHTLLREVVGIWGKTKNLSKLASETSELLKKMGGEYYH